MPDFSLKTDGSKWSLLFSLWAVHGIIALWQYLASVDDIGAFIADSSLRFFVFILLVAVVIVNIVFVLFILQRRLEWLVWNRMFLLSKWRDTLLISSLLILLLSGFLWVLFNLSSASPASQIDNYITLISPLISLGISFSSEIVALIFITEFKNDTGIANLDPKFVKRLLVVFGILGVLSVIIHFTGLGLVNLYEAGDWARGIPAVPLFEWHILLASILSVAFVWLELKDKFFDYKYMDLIVAVVIWLVTLIVWLGQPIEPNASALKPHAPNFEIYPFNDSQTYDQYAQSALVGSGFGDGVPPRSFYIAFLTIGHVFAGQDYEAIIWFQSFFFAFFPILLYFLGARFFGRPVGMSIALLSIFRDFTSNLVSPFTGNITYSKIFMSEIPTAMFLALFLLLAFGWIKQNFPPFTGFVMGGVLGLAMLIRTQSVVAAIVVLIFGFLASPRKWKSILTSILVMLLAIVLAISPWLLRNWQVTGQIIFDSPEYQMSNLALRYGRLNGLEANIVQMAGESFTEYKARLNDMAINAILADPQKSAWGVVNSFLNHGINNILLFPLRYELSDVGEFWIPNKAFWEWWSGEPTGVQSVLLFVYVFLFGLGVSVSWYRLGFLGLLPLGLNLAYNLWTSLALLSGQRFMVSMDWSISLYYMVGIFTLIGGVAMMLTRGRMAALAWVQKNSLRCLRYCTYKQTTSLLHYVVVGLVFLFLGTLPPVVEGVFPDRYPYLSSASITSGILASPVMLQSDVDSACVQKLAHEGLLVYVQGRALYPRYYNANDGERSTDAVGYKVVDESRIVFELVGQGNYRVVFPLSESPEYFPHASDVTLIYGDAGALWFIYIDNDSEGKFYVSNYFENSLCE